MLQLIGITKSFGANTVLNGVSLEVAKGTVTCVIGPSGSGKSTLLRSVGQLEPIDRGAVVLEDELIGHTVEGDRLRRARTRDVRRQMLRFGMVFQNFNLFPNMTALQNVSIALRRVIRMDDEQAAAVAERCLVDVGLGDKLASYPRQMSGGQQQRVAIARALAPRPEILLFDEPTSALDPELVGEVLAVMKKLAGQGATMLIVTHEMAFARDVADRVVVMDGGAIIEDGTPKEVFERPATDRARQFLRAIDPAAGAGTAPEVATGQA